MEAIKPSLARQLARCGVDPSDPQQLLATTIATLQQQQRQLAMLKQALVPAAPPSADALSGIGDTCLFIADELGAVSEMLAALQH